MSMAVITSSIEVCPRPYSEFFLPVIPGNTLKNVAHFEPRLGL